MALAPGVSIPKFRVPDFLEAQMRRTLRIAVATLPLLVLAGCGDDSLAPGFGTGSVQVINASPTAVDVRVDGALALSGLAVGALSTPLTVSAGSHAVQLVPAGGSTGGTVTLDVAANGRRTVAATRVNGNSQAMALVDTGSVVASGRSKLRVLHLAVSAPPLDIWRTQPDFQTPISILFPYVYLSGSTVESAAGTWEVRIWPTAAGQWSAPSASLSVPIASGQLRTVVTLDVPGGGVRLQLLEP